MKKIIYLLAIAALPITVLQAQTPKNDLSVYYLKGNVKSFNEITFEGEMKVGDLVNGKKTSRNFNTFNKSGFRTEQILEWENYAGSFKSITKFSYDSNNNMVETSTNDRDRIEITKKILNGRGDIVEENKYDSTGKLIGKTKYKYNSNNLNILKDVYNGEGKLEYSEELKYNLNNQLLVSERRDDTKKVTYIESYLYDNEGNVIEIKSSFRNRNGDMTQKSAVSYKMNVNKQVVMQTYTNSVSKSPTSVTNYEYDSKENVLRKVIDVISGIGMGSNVIISYEYTYDGQNNWIKKIETKASNYSETLIFTIEEREIKYY